MLFVGGFSILLLWMDDLDGRFGVGGLVSYSARVIVLDTSNSMPFFSFASFWVWAGLDDVERLI